MKALVIVAAALLAGACVTGDKGTTGGGGPGTVDARPVDARGIDACAPGLCLDPRCPNDNVAMGACSPIGLTCQYFENDLVCGNDGQWTCVNYGLEDHCAPFHDAGAPDSGSCAVTVHPCCGGAPPPCMPPLDGGGCPPGASFGACYAGNQPSQGCYVECTPPPTYCAPAGSSCQDVCGSSCGGGSTATDIYCLCA
jgi:hypothetical protein